MLRAAAVGLIAASALTSVEGFAGAPSALPLRADSRAAQCATAPTMSREGGAGGIDLSRRAVLLAALFGGPAAANAGPFDALESAKRRAAMKKGELKPPSEEAEVNPFEVKPQAKKTESPVKDLLKQGADQAKKAKAEREAAKAEKEAAKASKKEGQQKELPKIERKAKAKSDFVPPPRQEGKRLEPDTKSLLRKEKEEKARAAAKADAAAKNPALKAPKAEGGGGGFSVPKVDVPKFEAPSISAPSRNLFSEPGKKEKPKKEKKEKKEGSGAASKPKGPVSSTGYEAKGIDSLEAKLEKRRKQAEAAKAAEPAAVE